MKKNEGQIALGLRLRELREHNGKTKKRIAEVMGISTFRYTNIEKGTGVFYLGQAKKLAEYYNISLDDLMG